MGYKVIVDSCGELTEEMRKSGVFENVSLSMQVGAETIVDDETFNQTEFLRKVAECKDAPRSSCPSPKQYMERFLGVEERIYVVTLSAELSGSYNSAELGKKLFREEHEEEAKEKRIHVFNSCSASIGQTLIALKVRECEEAGMSFDAVVEAVEAYIESQHTYFVLENLDTLRKNGRLTGIKSLVAGALNIRPVMGSTPDGNICQKGQARGVNRALAKMVDFIVAEAGDAKEKILAISHCNCEARALEVKRMILEKLHVKDCFVLDTAGISSMYANDGGIIVVV